MTHIVFIIYYSINSNKVQFLELFFLFKIFITIIQFIISSLLATIDYDLYEQFLKDRKFLLGHTKVFTIEYAILFQEILSNLLLIPEQSRLYISLPIYIKMNFDSILFHNFIKKLVRHLL